MSKANRKRQYEKNKDNKTNHLLSDALKREFEGDERTPEQAEAEAKKKAEQKLSEDDVVDMDEVEQTKILNDHGVTKIPKSESGRVKKIMELQDA